MPRKLRVEYPGVFYHVMNRGDRREVIFADEQDRWCFLGPYTSRFNRRRREFGHLLSGRYKALLVDGSGDGYLKTVCDYVHLNPAKRGRSKLLTQTIFRAGFGNAAQVAS